MHGQYGTVPEMLDGIFNSDLALILAKTLLIIVKNELTLEVEEEFYPHLSMEDLPNQLVDAKLVIYKL